MLIITFGRIKRIWLFEGEKNQFLRNWFFFLHNHTVLLHLSRGVDLKYLDTYISHFDVHVRIVMYQPYMTNTEWNERTVCEKSGTLFVSFFYEFVHNNIWILNRSVALWSESLSTELIHLHFLYCAIVLVLYVILFWFLDDRTFAKRKMQILK